MEAKFSVLQNPGPQINTNVTGNLESRESVRHYMAASGGWWNIVFINKNY